MASSSKNFGIPADQIRSLAKRHGGCFASDLITVHGKRVGYMYREVPTQKWSSGWVFMAGTETAEFMEDPNNHGIYDVNTVANYDPGIIPLLGFPAPCAFERLGGSGKFVSVPPPQPE